VKITEKGDSDFAAGAIVPVDALEQVNNQIEALGGDSAKGAKPKPATASTQLLGITKAAVQSSSFISAASFQETTKVLTEAALAGKVDNLVGLKENVILGHLIPAGTGFRTYQDSEVRIQPEALEALAAEKRDVLARAFPLLDGPENESPPAIEGDGSNATGDPSAPAGAAVDALGEFPSLESSAEAPPPAEPPAESVPGLDELLGSEGPEPSPEEKPDE
jgi:DNA-directed RNA polymerase subunit beta'